MWIEALKPLTVRLSEGDLHLQPGKPVDLPEYQARRLLKKASGKVRIVEEKNTAWLTAWRKLAALTNGLMAEDARFGAVTAAIEECDVAFLAGDWGRFQDGVRTVEQIVYRES